MDGAGSGWVPAKRRTPAWSHRPRHQGDGRGWTVDFLCSPSGRVAADAAAACINFHPETRDRVEGLIETVYVKYLCWSGVCSKECTLFFTVNKSQRIPYSKVLSI